jgi:hypothetical protein
MNGFLSSLKADLLDRRLLPLVVLVAAALVAALAYAVLGGGSSATTPTAVVSTGPVTAPSGLAASQKTPAQAVAETTGGVSTQHQGAARNPFTPLPEAKATAASSTATGAASSTTSAAPASSSAGGTTSTTPSTPSTPVTPSKPSTPKTVYHVAVLFGVLPAAGSAQSVQLTPYEDLKLLTLLPSDKQPLIIFRGVTAGGKSATFTLVGETILHGDAACLPSAAHCEAIDLQAGQAEQLEYLSPEGQTVVYELKVVSIAASTASVSDFRSVMRGQSKAGRELLVRAGLEAIPDLRFSSRAGVLVFGGHPSFGRRASIASAHLVGRNGLSR